MLRSFLIAISLLLFFSTNSIASDENSDLYERFKTERLSVGLMVLSDFNYSLEDDSFNGGRSFRQGATRLSFRGNLDSGFSYLMQLDFRNSPSILDAQVGYRFSDDFQILAGMQKPETGAGLDMSPADTDFMNRPRLIGTMMNARELGITAYTTPGNFNFSLGVYNGTGRTFTNDNRFMYSLRMGYTFETAGGVVDLGTNTALNRTENEAVGNTGLVSREHRITYGGFISYDSDGFFANAEVLQTNFEEANTFMDETISSAYLTLGYNLTEKDEIAARWDYLAFDTSNRSSDRFTLGYSRYATDLIKLMVNVLGEVDNAGDTHFGVSGRMQFRF